MNVQPFVRALKLAGVLLTLCALPALAQEASDRVAPEAAGGGAAKDRVTSRDFMVVSAHPLASEAGRTMLEKGGNAVDAMVAVQAVLGLVEPQSSGLGGGAFLVHWDEARQKLTTLDGRETAPAAATPDLFLDQNGEPLRFFDAVIGGRSVGTPGTVALLEAAHQRHGKLAWAELFMPAIALAEDGFPVSPRLNALIAHSAESLFRYEATRRYFLSEEGVPLPPGTILRNAAYASTLRDIAANGAKAFYEGEIARDIVAAVREAEDNPGLLSEQDLASYRVLERAPVCVTYRVYEVCGMGPPSSGALTIGQILKLVEPHDLAGLGPDNPQSWRLIGDASRLAFADRDLYMADSDFVDMPKGLLNATYLAERARLLEGDRALEPEAVKPGSPPTDHAGLFAPGATPELPSTSHFS
ncbi:MAG: gamma-glutamyltransferase family protein, partial [Pseudomonadota bacterium]|nr:gamma-glutamyltransferase family protein [Pseudomonadota bacterium]